MRNKPRPLDAATVRDRADLVASLMALLALSPDEAAICANCSAAHIRRECQRGALAGTRIGRLWRIPPRALEAWLTSTSQRSLQRVS